MSELFEGIPEILYKYRTWNNLFHKNLLLKQELYFASSEQFNDPFDCNLPYEIDKSELTPDNIFLKYLDMSRTRFPEKTETELHEITYKEQAKNRFDNEQHWEYLNEYHKNMIRKNIGILSLGEVEDSLLMWSHYANSHWGYCIGFDKYKLLETCKGAITKIAYEVEFPKYNIFQNTSDFAFKSLFIKSKVWKYEQEWRITKNGSTRQVINFNNDAVLEIIFGANMAHKTKLEFLAIIEDLYPESRVYEMNLNKTSFRLNKDQIR